MLLVSMKCVNCSILFRIPSILSCNMFMLWCVFYYYEMGEGSVEVWLWEESDFPVLAVCEVCGWMGVRCLAGGW